MVKLTSELINNSFQFMNACRERELDLRGYKIPQIENLGATLDQFDTIDLSDNDLRKLDGLPYLQRLKCLLLNNNRILRIGEGVQEALPNLSSIILTGNNIQEFGDLEPLSQMEHLDTICLLGNTVSLKEHYRDYMAYKFPKLRLLDFKKIKPKDRAAAKEFFKTKQGKDMLKEIAKQSKISAAAAVSAEPAHSLSQQTSGSRIANEHDVQRIRDAIQRAKSLQEVELLTQILNSGRLPDNFTFETGINGSVQNGRVDMSMEY